MFKKAILLAISAALMPLTACGVTPSETNQTIKTQTQMANGLEVTLTAIDQSDNVSSSGFIPPADKGATYVTATYTIKNTTSKVVPFTSWPQIKLQDAAGNKLDPEIGGSTFLSAAANASWAENLNPGLSTEVHLLWKVDKKSFTSATWKLVAVELPRAFALT